MKKFVIVLALCTLLFTGCAMNHQHQTRGPSPQNQAVTNLQPRQNPEAERLVHQWDTVYPRGQAIDDNTFLYKITYEGVTDTLVMHYTYTASGGLSVFTQRQKDVAFDIGLHAVRLGSSAERRALKQVFEAVYYLEHRYHNEAGQVIMSLVYDSTVLN